MNKEDIIRDCFYKSKYLDIINEYNNGEHNKEYLAKKYHIQLQRLAGKTAVDSLELYQYDFNSVLFKDNTNKDGRKQ